MQQINQIKQEVEKQMGKTVHIKASLGRKRTFSCSGVICGVYPNIFALAVKTDGQDRILTYSYKDVLIKTVQFLQPNS